MQLSPPKNSTFYAGVILWAAGLASPFIPALDTYTLQGLGAGYLFAILGGLVIILGNVLKGL